MLYLTSKSMSPYKYNYCCNLRIVNKSNPLFPNFLLLLSAFEEDHETLKVENNISLVQDQEVFVCGDLAAVIGAMAKYKTTRKEVARNLKKCAL